MGSILMILGLLIIYNMGGVNNSENPDLLIIYNMGGGKYVPLMPPKAAEKKHIAPGSQNRQKFSGRLRRPA